ncbi:TPA: hypothetical protein RQJ16_001857 [Campylobacter fetus subsp. venerealis]|nr:hypothetical protein [Campylobacter fetus subsp. venerealis]HDX6321166.1 hypothetical protein [Campylobacter fetus subsp. venerealis]HDX6323121.1 hypothetical protein [Campylobacter fetus subsp. venerealis]HDX8136010.1 hypothetical protein [Campylobacter fetus subsp. venerealis]
MKHIIFTFLMALCFTGCVRFNPQYFNSTIERQTQSLNFSVLADDMANFISSHFLANNTIFYIYTDDLDKNFYNYLTDKLRNKGYAISDDSSIKGLTFLSYNILEQDNKIYMSYNINEKKVNRAYEIIDNKLVPIGNITTFNFNN